MADVIAARSPSVTVLVNGGEVAFEMYRAVSSGDGPWLYRTDRWCDAAAHASPDEDLRAARIAGSSLTAIVPVQDIEAVRTAVVAALT